MINLSKLSVVSNKSASKAALDKVNKNYKKCEKKFRSKLNVNLGVNIESGLNLNANLNDKQVAIFGKSGFGKTHLIKSMLVEMISENMSKKLGFVIIDPKITYPDFRDIKYTKFYTNEFNLNILHDLNLIKLVRQNSFYEYENELKYFNVKQAKKLIKVKHLVIVIDDLLLSYNNLFEKNNSYSEASEDVDANFYAQINEAFNKFIDNFRNSQMTLITASQRTIDKAYSRSLINNADYKFIFASYFESDVEKFTSYNLGRNDAQLLSEKTVHFPISHYDIFDANDANFNNIDTAIAPFDEKGLDSIINAINKFK